VVTSIGLDAENRVRVQFTGEKQQLHARVCAEFLDFDRDVAILKVDSVPVAVIPLRLGKAAECRSGSKYYSFGYATAA
jgi:hypothetical protein